VKRILTIIGALCACAFTAQAQGTFQFQATLTGANEVPPNSDPTVATGTFSLMGNSLSFTVNVPLITFIAQNAYIQGPALAGNTGPIIFDLGGPVFHSGSQGEPPYAAFFSPYTPPFGAGPFILTSSQIKDLENGLWYINVTSYAMTNGQVRGQILFQTAGKFQFNTTLTGTHETIPNTSPYVGSGWFTLDGNVLNYGVGLQDNNVFYPTSAGIYGPATNGQDGPLIFDFGNYLTSFNPFAITYGGGFFLTPQQVRDLVSGRWYVNFLSTNYPDGEIRGPIVLQSAATLTGPVLTSNSFQFTVSEVANLNYMVQASTNLASTNWIPLLTNVAPFTFTDSGFTNHPRRFYRAVYSP